MMGLLGGHVPVDHSHVEWQTLRSVHAVWRGSARTQGDRRDQYLDHTQPDVADLRDGDNRKSTRPRTELTTTGAPPRSYEVRVYNTAFMRNYSFSHPSPRYGRDSSITVRQGVLDGLLFGHETALRGRVSAGLLVASLSRRIEKSCKGLVER